MSWRVLGHRDNMFMISHTALFSRLLKTKDVMGSSCTELVEAIVSLALAKGPV
jgi:hypothetical protein